MTLAEIADLYQLPKMTERRAALLIIELFGIDPDRHPTSTGEAISARRQAYIVAYAIALFQAFRIELPLERRRMRRERDYQRRYHQTYQRP